MNDHTRLLPLLATVAAVAFGCSPPPPPPLSRATPRAVQRAEQRDFELEVCRARLAAVQAEPVLPGAPQLQAERAAILGRALGEPVLFVQAPTPTRTATLPAALRDELRAAPPTGVRRASWLIRHLRGRRAALRALLLRQGYLYTEDPLTALVLVRKLTLASLFDAPRIWLARGADTSALERQPVGHRGRFEYRYAAGARRGHRAKLLFGDRLASERRDLGRPLHRDVRALRDALDFDRMAVVRLGAQHLVARLRFGSIWVRALLDAEGARLKLGCYDAPATTRRQVAAYQQAHAPHRLAIARLRAAVQASIDDKLPFDRPRGVTDELTDGQLRPQWEQAYRLGHSSFVHDEQRYFVFDASGRPAPPQMCVEMIVDAFERAAGSWYLPRGQRRARSGGALDFRSLGLRNRSGVLAFGDYAQAHPELFDTVRLPAAERVPFAKRRRFFRYFLEHADLFAPGDVIAIRGPKRDSHLHQHAILIADVDPLTGFPYALVDQMRWPRRRTFEAIMAPAPRRSLLYRARPTEALLRRLTGQAGAR